MGETHSKANRSATSKPGRRGSLAGSDVDMRGKGRKRSPSLPSVLEIDGGVNTDPKGMQAPQRKDFISTSSSSGKVPPATPKKPTRENSYEKYPGISQA